MKRFHKLYPWAFSLGGLAIALHSGLSMPGFFWGAVVGFVVGFLTMGEYMTSDKAVREFMEAIVCDTCPVHRRTPSPEHPVEQP